MIIVGSSILVRNQTTSRVRSRVPHALISERSDSHASAIAREMKIRGIREERKGIGG